MTTTTESIDVLHVDDEPEFADLTATFLERADERISVRTATSAEDGLALLDDVDCVVSDYDMPGRNGIEFLEAVREEHPDLPFILYTGKGSEAVAADAISAGVTDYLQKEGGTDQYAILANRIRNVVERTRAERDGEQMRERMELALEHTDSVVFEIDLDTERVVRHGAFEEFFDRPAAEVPTWEDHLDRAVHPDDRAAFRSFYRGLVDGERDGGTLEYRTNPDSGRVRWIADTVSVERRSADGGGLAVGLARDVTGQKERERELETLLEKTEQVLDATDTVIWGVDPETETMTRRGPVERVLGISPEEGPTWESFVTAVAHPDDRAALRELFRRLATGERPSEELTYRVRTDADDPRWVWVNGQRKEATDGEGHRIVGLARDVTERERRERELERKTGELEAARARLEEQYRTLFEEAPVMTVVTREEQGRPIIEDCNDQFLDLVGYDAEAVVGSELATFYTADSRTQLLDEGGYERSLEDAFTQEHRELLTADGEVVETLLRAVPRRDTAGEVVGTLAMYVDVTEREVLKRANERLEEFTSIVSHDLRNPLTVARGNLELARQECDSEYLDDVAWAHDRMSTLVDDLLTLAREGEQVGEVEPVALADVVQACWENVVTADATLRTETDRTIRADRSRLQQLLENLMRNAVEHGSTDPDSQARQDAVEHGSTSPRSQAPEEAVEHGGEDVTVTVGDLDDGFYVEDDGHGIPPDDREAVFEAGYSTAREGTGFGLSIVKQIVDAHGWEVRITESEAGGARFEITDVELAP